MKWYVNEALPRSRRISLNRGTGTRIHLDFSIRPCATDRYKPHGTKPLC